MAKKAENKAKAQHSWGLGFFELGTLFIIYLIIYTINLDKPRVFGDPPQGAEHQVHEPLVLRLL